MKKEAWVWELEDDMKKAIKKAREQYDDYEGSENEDSDLLAEYWGEVMGLEKALQIVKNYKRRMVRRGYEHCLNIHESNKKSKG